MFVAPRHKHEAVSSNPSTYSKNKLIFENS